MTAALRGSDDAVVIKLNLFVDSVDQPRARRATDLILLLGSLVGLGVVGLIARPEPGYSQAVGRFVGALPDALTGTFQLLADLPGLWAIILVGAAVALSRWKIARDMVFAVVAAGVLTMFVARLVGGSWPELMEIFRDVAPPEEFPTLRLGVPTALIVAASPHLVRPARRIGYFVVALGAFATLALGASSALGVVASLLVAAVAAAAIHLAVGSSAGRPSLDDVAHALAEMRVPVADLGLADRQDAGVFAVTAVDDEGRELLIKLYGRDAHDAALVSTVWRTVWLRQPGSPVGVRRLRQVEHEALLTLLAAQAGIPTDAVVTAGATRRDDAVLVLRRAGVPLVERNRFDDVEAPPPAVFSGAEVMERVGELWDLVTRLHDGNMAHGQIDEDHLVLVDGRLGLIGFRGSTVSPTAAAFGRDQAQVLLTTVGLVGVEAAIAGVREHRSAEQVEDMLPYLQTAALTADHRRVLKVLEVNLDELRTQVAASAEVESPPLVRLRRFTVGSVLRIALPALAVFMLVSALAGFDYAELAESLQDASWWLVALGFVIAQTPRVAQSVSTLGAAPIPLPLGPVYALQLAISYVNLAIPTMAARIAVNVRFFQRQGVSPTQAVATGALDGVSGFIVQVTLLTSLLLFTSMSLDVDVGDPASAALRVVVWLAIVLAVVGVVVAAIPRLRRRVVAAVRHTVSEAFVVLRGLRSFRRIVMLFGGNVMAELLFAFALGVFVQAFGVSLPLHELLFINMVVALFAGLIPVPGGIGVTEAGLIFGLTSFGVPQETAFAAVILYRFATFYLPPIWGFVALRWLEGKRYL